ncbi:MAG: PPC domain-containing protein [Verrucomicrobiae bacterium]|nr:PPC domain-containing protein [Verrucomicrobiae bacterium]
MKRILNFQSAASKILSKRVLAAFGLSALAASGGCLQAASPDFNTTIPRGGQAGSEVKVTIMGNRLSDAEAILFHQPGMSFKDLKVIDDRKVEATLVIAKDCRLGEHHFRVRCRSGISYARNFWVSQFPNVDEVEPNDDFEAPQKIPMNVTIEAEAKPEETDYYLISVKKGDRISVEVEGLRINNIPQNIAIDPYVAILNKDRFEIASADGSSLLKQESILSIEAPEDGDYVVEVRDSAYQGRGRYRAHIGHFPRPTAIYPAGGKAGSEMEFTLLGDVKGSYPFKVKLPESGENDLFGVFATNGGLLPPSPNLVRLSPFENTLEKEPNNSNAEATDAGAIPVAFNGILSEEGDVDFFKFTAKKDQTFQFRVFADSIGSPVDPVLTIYNEKMGSVGSSDDADGTKDSRVDFKAPADGVYFVRITDMLSRGGSDFVYRVEPTTPAKTIDVTMPEMLRRDFQYLKQFDIPQGGYYAMVVNTTRKGVAGDLVLEMPKLPAGVTMEAGTIPRSVSQFPILLKAAPDAPVGGGFYDLVAKTAEGDAPVAGRFVQTLDLVRGPQNGVEYYSRPFDKLPVSVVDPLPYSVALQQPKVPLVRNGSMKLKIRADRKDGYDKPITVRFPWLPPGISSPATMTLDGKTSEIEYELNANENAEVNTWNLTVIAESDGGKGKMFSASPFIKLSVEEPFVQIKLTMASAKQGETVEMLAEVEHLREFAGDGEVQLFGLPAHSTAQPAKLKPDMESLNFPIVTSDKTPVGQHKGVFCTATLIKDGEPIVHRLSMGSVFRVDPKPKEVAAAPAPAQAKPAEKKEKPLSRLEQLRLEAKKEGATP